MHILLITLKDRTISPKFTVKEIEFPQSWFKMARKRTREDRDLKGNFSHLPFQEKILDRGASLRRLEEPVSAAG